MSTTSWNSEEDYLLEGLPWIAQLVYLRGLRRQMDCSTGIVGQRFGISRATIAQVLYIEPSQGRRDYGYPTKKAVIKALETLQKVGLIEKIPADRALIFRLPYADVDVDKSPSKISGADVGFAKQGRPEHNNHAGTVERNVG